MKLKVFNEDARKYVREYAKRHEIQTRENMLHTSDLGAELAEELAREGYLDEARETWNTAKEVAETAADVGTDLIPGVSFVKDSNMIITGINPVTGEPVETWERVFAGVTLFIPSVFTKPAKWAFKGIAKVYKTRKIGGVGNKAAQKTQNIFESARKSGKFPSLIQGYQMGGEFA